MRHGRGGGCCFSIGRIPSLLGLFSLWLFGLGFSYLGFFTWFAPLEKLAIKAFTSLPFLESRLARVIP